MRERLVDLRCVYTLSESVRVGIVGPSSQVRFNLAGRRYVWGLSVLVLVLDGRRKGCAGLGLSPGILVLLPT